MLIGNATGRHATLVRLAGLLAVSWSIFSSHVAPATSGRGLVVLLAFVPACIAWLVWTFWSSKPITRPATTPVAGCCARASGAMERSSASAGAAYLINTLP